MWFNNNNCGCGNIWWIIILLLICGCGNTGNNFNPCENNCGCGC